MAPALRFMLGVVSWFLVFAKQGAQAMKHDFNARHDPRHLIGPVGVPFGFLAGGKFSLTVKNFKLTTTLAQRQQLLEAGFWLQRFPNEAAFQHFLNEVQANATGCVFEYFRSEPDDEIFDQVGEIESAQPHGIFVSMKDESNWEHSTTIDYTFNPGEEGLYFLVYQVCSFTEKRVRTMSSFHLDFHFMNYDAFERPSFLTAGEMHLPLLYTLSAISFTVCAILWQWNLSRIRWGLPAIIRTKEEQASPSAGRPTIFAIHPIMGLLLWVKALTVWAEAFRFHSIKVTGHAEAWSALYYTLYFFRGTFLFTVILLIGTGWSFVKGVMQRREKLFIFLVLFLQMLNQLALIVLSQETEGERQFGNWNAVLHLVDILCCCSVLLPIVWQVNAMEASLQVQDDDDPLSPESRSAILEKLKLFRLFYLLVIAYIYATRILIYLFATVLDYKHLWVRYAVVELVTLVFYVTVGLLFRPRVERMIAATSPGKEEEEGVALIQQSASVSEEG